MNRIIALSEQKIMRRSLPFSLILTLCTGFSSVASAKNIQAITKFVIPAYTAMNLQCCAHRMTPGS